MQFKLAQRSDYLLDRTKMRKKPNLHFVKLEMSTPILQVSVLATRLHYFWTEEIYFNL